MSGKEGKVFNGIVKFYNVAKGYGFLYADDLVDDVYFHINDWKNKSIPEAGDKVEFNVVKQGAEKTKAILIFLLEAAPEKKTNDDRIACPHCERKMVPRVVFSYGRPMYSVCPYCGKMVKDFNGFATIVNSAFNPKPKSKSSIWFRVMVALLLVVYIFFLVILFAAGAR